MAISTDERREVAKRMWAVSPGDTLEDELLALYAACDMTIEDDFLHIYLAQLIEPEPERTCRMELTELSSASAFHDTWRCLSCGEEIERHTVMGKSDPPNYCPNCGAKVVE